MSCPHCLSTSVSKRKFRTALGYRTFYCRDCDRRFNERSGTPFNDLQFPTEIVLLAVLWRYLYRAIDREGNLLDSMLSERGDKHAARRFLRRLIDRAAQKPLRMTTDKHPAYTKAIRWIVGRKVLHRHNQYLNN